MRYIVCVQVIMKKENLLNKKFNLLTVIEEAPKIKGRSAWKCKCDCGAYKIIKSEELKSGGTKSCGCLNSQRRSERASKMYLSRKKYAPQEATARKIWKTRYCDGISFEDFLKLSQQNCYYCGDPPGNNYNSALDDNKSSLSAKENGTFIYNGLDRLNNSIGHILDNVVPCCKYCNFAKRERSVEHFLTWIKKVHLHSVK